MTAAYDERHSTSRKDKSQTKEWELRITKRRFLMAAGGLATTGALATMVSGVTFGLFSTQQTSGGNTFTAGTVTLANSAETDCTITGMMPGDSSTGWGSGSASDAPCSLTATYSGNSAYEAIDVYIATKAGGGTGQTAALYDGSNSTGLNVSIKDNQSSPVTYSIPTSSSKTATTCPTGYTTGYTCYLMANEILHAAGATVASDQFTVQYSLPSATGNTYQAGVAVVVLNVHAVQQANNAITCSTTAPSASFTAGSPCTPTAGSWS